MRFALLITAALAASACNQSPPAEQPAADAPADTGVLAEARVNMAPVDPAKAKTVMHERHEGMEAVGKAMKQLSRDMKASPLDLAAVKPNAAKMADLASQSASWFPAGTGPDVGKTGAKPEIWQKPQDFAAKLTAWQNASAAFNKAAASGNAAATQAAFGDLGKSCKACHDLYRNKDVH